MKLSRSLFFASLVASTRPFAAAVLRDDSWFQFGNALVGTPDDRGVGEHAIFSSNPNVMMEAHSIEEMHGHWVTPSAIQVSVYIYDEAFRDWLPFGEPLLNEFDEGYDSTIAQVAIQSSKNGLSSHTVAILETQFSFDDDDESDITVCNSRIHVYNLRFAKYFDGGIIERPDEYKDCADSMWGRSFALSQSGSVAVGVLAMTGGFIQIYESSGDWLSPSWNPVGSPLAVAHGVPSFGSVIKMNDAGTIVVGQGCRDEDDEKHPGCFVRAFQKDENGESWSQLGEDVDIEGKGDLLAFDLDTGLSLVIGGLYIDPTCPENNPDGHIRAFAFDTTEGDWIQMGQDIESIVDFSNAKMVEFGHHVSIADNRMAVSVAWDDKNTGESSSVQSFIYDGSSWSIEGNPVPTGTLGSGQLSRDGSKMVVGAPYGVFYMGSVQTLIFDDRRAVADRPSNINGSSPRPKAAKKRVGVAAANLGLRGRSISQ